MLNKKSKLLLKIKRRRTNYKSNVGNLHLQEADSTTRI